MSDTENLLDDPERRRRAALVAITWVTAVLVAGIGGAAGFVSFHSLEDLAASRGFAYPPIMPVCIDGAIVVGVFLGLYMELDKPGEGGMWVPHGMVLAGTGFSVLVQMVMAPTTDLDGRLIAAAPPAMQAVCWGVLVYMIHRLLRPAAGRAADRNRAAPRKRPAPRPGRVRDLTQNPRRNRGGGTAAGTEAAARGDHKVPHGDPAGVPGTGSGTGTAGPEQGSADRNRVPAQGGSAGGSGEARRWSRAEALQVARQVKAEARARGVKPTGQMVGDALGGKSARHGTDLLAELAAEEQGQPYLHAVGGWDR